ncbi:hypothetical protein OG568_22385 [Streptomyces sp. NBC_01450]|uniref:hypothetical protein n=1 Tax=Streptomyces sp. NBC_01450 TaxID=2903871 RepID=UPI002E32C24D|nr:hypothetical protein [Streptomyces sp. NBC_01450]
MTAPSRPPLKSITATPAGPHTAPQPVDTTAVGEPKGAARQGVVSALPRSKRFPDGGARHDSGNPTPDQPGIRIYAPPVYRFPGDPARWSKRYGSTPTAAYACACGQTGTATGPRGVAALVADYDAHKAACTGTPATLTDGRTAA